MKKETAAANKAERISMKVLLFMTGLLALASSGLVAAGGGFSFRGTLDRVITPNGDGKNDIAFFCIYNPKDSGVSGTISNFKGVKVADMTGPVYTTNSACPSQSGDLTNLVGYMSWDGKSNGIVVESGVYVYVITAEGRSVSGTVVVAR